MDPVVSPDGRTYWSDQHKLWLPISSRAIAEASPSASAPAAPPAVAAPPAPPAAERKSAGALAAARWPASLGDLLRTRTWYLAAIGYAALLVIVADLEYVVLKLAGGSVLELALLDIAAGAVMGVLVGWRPQGHPVWTVVATAFLAGLLGTVFDLAVLGSRQFRQVWDGQVWRQVGPDTRSYWGGQTWVAFTPGEVAGPPMFLPGPSAPPA